VITNSLGMISGASPFSVQAWSPFFWSLLLSLSSNIFTRAILCLLFHCSFRWANLYGSFNTEQLLTNYAQILRLFLRQFLFVFSTYPPLFFIWVSLLYTLCIASHTDNLNVGHWICICNVNFQEWSDGWTHDYTTSGGFPDSQRKFWEWSNAWALTFSGACSEAHPNNVRYIVHDTCVGVCNH